MKTWRLVFVVLCLAAVSAALLATVEAAAVPRLPVGGLSQPDPGNPDAHKVQHLVNTGPSIGPDHLTHPCAGMLSEPLFSGLSPLAIAFGSTGCTGNDYGDITVWQANGHDYVGVSGFSANMFRIWNVDDPYNPQLLFTQPDPSGGTVSTSISSFKQGSNRYLSVTERGGGTGCGFFVYNVNNPSAPAFVNRKTGTDWCTPHEHFVSKNTNGDADYAWVAMSAESGSGDKMVVLDLSNLAAITQTGRYERPDGASFIHDSNVVGNRVYLAHWSGGVIIHDKATLASSINPAAINPVDSIRPSGFMVHHMVPTTDNKFLFIEDEFLNTSNAEKIKYYNITNPAAPFYIGGIIGSGVAATSQAHNLVIKPVSPGHDILFVAWYRAGTRVFDVDTTGATPVVTEIGMHQLLTNPGPGFGNVWGVDYMACTLDGQPHTCVYSADMQYGLVVDALGYDPALDPYFPESAISSPTNGQNINVCNFTIQGTAHDYYSGLQSIEVSTNNGGTWSPASGTTNWSYSWNITADGPFAIKVRSTDAAGNVQTSGAVNVTVSGGCAAAPPSPTSTPTAPTATPAPPTATPVVTPALVGHVFWEGRGWQPNASHQLPLTLTLKLGGTEVNYPPATTDASGFFTVNVSGMPNGTYSWRIKGPHATAGANTGPGFLSNMGTVALTGAAETQQEMGTLRSGDANNNDTVDITDFNTLLPSFGSSSVDPNYNPRPDFNGDNVVDIADFNLLKINFGTNGSPPIRPER